MRALKYTPNIYFTDKALFILKKTTYYSTKMIAK